MNLPVILSHLYKKKNELLRNQYYYDMVREEQDDLLIKTNSAYVCYWKVQ